MNILVPIIICLILGAFWFTSMSIIQDVACHDCKLKNECDKHKEETGRTYCDEKRMTRIYEHNLFNV